MKRTLALVGLLVVGLLLLFDPDTGIVTAAVESTTTTDVVAAAPATTTTTGAPPAPETSTSSPSTTTEAAASSTTTTTTNVTDSTQGTFSVVGDAFDSPFGAFQVEIVIENGVMVDIITVEEPPDRRSQRINDSVIPIYTEDAISSQSADFDAISGATVTWDSWGASLETALFEAGV
jgi:uncharacterized protein with FMN-binding domain